MKRLRQAPHGRLVALIVASHFLGYADRGAPGAFAPGIKASFALTDAEVGALQGAPFVVSYVLATLWAGRRMRHLRPGRYMALCVLLWTLSALAFALAPSYGGLILSRIGLGLGLASFSPIALVVLASLSGGSGGRPISLFTAASSTGRSSGLLLGGALMAVAAATPLLAGSEPWRAAGLIMALPNLILVVLLWRAPWPRVADDGEAPGLSDVVQWVMRHARAIGSHLIAACGVIMIVQACGAWASSILARDFQLDAGQAAIIAGAVSLTAAPAGHLTGGWLSERRRTGTLLAVSAAMAAAGALALVIAPSLVLAVLALAVLMGASGCGAAVSLIGLQPLAPAPMRRGMNSVFLAAITVFGTALGPYLTGVLSDAMSVSGERLAVALAATTCAAAFLVAVAALTSAAANQALTAKIREQT